MALVEIEPPADNAPSGERIRHRSGTTFQFPAALRARLKAQTGATPVSLDEFGRLDTALGSFIAGCCNEFLAREALSAKDISAFGSHGQTLRHQPPSTAEQDAFTLQIGNPHQIVEQTGITTIADFRGRDLAAGGEGAPLAPLYHAALFSAPTERRWILNLGGIANLTRLFPGAPVIGFDTGPANALIDAWCAEHRGQPYDADGLWAASGTLVLPLLDRCLTDPYFALPPPKSTGKERFNLAWINEQLSGAHGYPAEDVQRTLVELTAISALSAIPESDRSFDRLLLCGGGRLNPLLVARLQAHCSAPVEDCAAYGADGDSLEASLFAWLAYRCVHGIPSAASSITGATGARILGVCYPARGR